MGSGDINPPPVNVWSGDINPPPVNVWSGDINPPPVNEIIKLCYTFLKSSIFRTVLFQTIVGVSLTKLVLLVSL